MGRLFEAIGYWLWAIGYRLLVVFVKTTEAISARHQHCALLCNNKCKKDYSRDGVVFFYRWCVESNVRSQGW